MRHDNEFGDYVAILQNLHAYRSPALTMYGRHSTEQRVEHLQRQVKELHDQVGIIASALNEAWKKLEPEKAVTV